MYGSDYFRVKPFPVYITQHFSKLFILYTYLPTKTVQSVPKRRHIKFRRRGITQKKAYNRYGVCYNPHENGTFDSVLHVDTPTVTRAGVIQRVKSLTEEKR